MVKTYVYTLYYIIPSKDDEYVCTYKQVSKYYAKEHICYKVNEILKNKYEERKKNYINQLSYFEEAEEDNSYRRTQLRNMIKSEYITKTFEEIMSYYKNNDVLFYTNERLYDYRDSFNDFFITESYIID